MRASRDSSGQIYLPMVVPEDQQPLPRTTLGWLIAVAIAATMVALGIVAFTHQTQVGFIATMLRNAGYGGAPWGVYIGFDVFFVGVSFAGITVAALCRLFDIEQLR